jgi:hypothetical protein
MSFTPRPRELPHRAVSAEARKHYLVGNPPLTASEGQKLWAWSSRTELTLWEVEQVPGGKLKPDSVVLLVNAFGKRVSKELRECFTHKTAAQDTIEALEEMK